MKQVLQQTKETELGKKWQISARDPVFKRRQAAAAAAESHTSGDLLSLGNLSPGKNCLLD